jgi:hypothetical protein
MIQAIFAIFAAMFALKIIWTLGLPYWLSLKAYRDVTRSPAGVSLMPGVEVVPLLCMTAAAALVHEVWGLTPSAVALIGSAVMVGSYVHLFLVSFALRWLIGFMHRRRNRDK